MCQDVLKKIIENKSYFDEIIAEFPEMYSFCVRIRQKLSNEIVDESLLKILEFYNSNRKFKKKINLLTSKKNTELDNTKNVSGLILVIDKKEETYTNLMKRINIEKWQYKGISIIDDFNSIRLYFY